MTTDTTQLLAVVERGRAALAQIGESTDALEMLGRLRDAEAALARLPRIVWERLLGQVESFDDAWRLADALTTEFGESIGTGFFTQSGTDLLAGCLLASAVGNSPLEDIERWLCSDQTGEAIQILKENHPAASKLLWRLQYLPLNTRDGITWFARSAIATWPWRAE